jgi:hypothetical protein
MDSVQVEVHLRDEVGRFRLWGGGADLPVHGFPILNEPRVGYTGSDERRDGLRVFGGDQFALLERREVAEINDGAAEAAQEE